MIEYKIDILEELKNKGYSTYILRKNKYLSETTIANIRAGKPVTMKALDAICIMLRKTPEEIINFEISDNDKIKYFVWSVFVYTLKKCIIVLSDGASKSD